MSRDIIEFYCNGLITTARSSFRPNKGDLISIRGTAFEIIHTSFSFDFADKSSEARMRLNVELREYHDGK